MVFCRFLIRNHSIINIDGKLSEYKLHSKANFAYILFQKTAIFSKKLAFSLMKEKFSCSVLLDAIISA